MNRMKKLILKTALITFGVTIILAVSLFGIVSFCAPASMMRFCESLGLENISGDYAYQEYQNTKELSYLAHAFEVAADGGSYVTADERFEELYGEENSDQRSFFAAFCKMQNNSALPDGVPAYGYRAYLCGRAACVKYHLARTDDERAEVCAFAIGEAEPALSEDSPLFALALEAIDREDGAFCALLREKISAETKFEKENEYYQTLENFLSDAVKMYLGGSK